MQYERKGNGMDNFAQFREETARRFAKIETHVSELGVDMAVIKETLNERRRQTDKIEDLLTDINNSVNEIQSRLSGYRMSFAALIKATAIIFSILAALGTVLAAAWSLIKEILTDT
jgi:septal ring factor EnvC (AmiA/AmiB activator)